MADPARQGPYWTEARAVLDVVGPDAEATRTFALDRPFAIVGRCPDADIRIDDRAANSRHAYCHVDARGLFVVDLASRTGTRVGDGQRRSGWVEVGDSIEVAGRTIHLRSIDRGGEATPARATPACLLDDLDDDSLPGLLLAAPGPRAASWRVGSPLTFVGRGEACAIRLNQADVSRVHCAFFRSASAAYLIEMPGRPTLISGRSPRGATRLVDGDELQIGGARFVARVHPPAIVGGPPAAPSSTVILEDLPVVDGLPFPIELIPPESRDAVVGWMLAALHAGQAEILRRQSELQTAVAQIIDRLPTSPNQNFSDLKLSSNATGNLPERASDQGPPLFHAPIPAPKALNPTSTSPTPSLVTATWLLERIEKLEQENRFSLKLLLRRLTRGRPSPTDIPVDSASTQSGSDTFPPA